MKGGKMNMDGKHENETKLERVSHKIKIYIQRVWKREKRRVFRFEAKSDNVRGCRMCRDRFGFCSSTSMLSHARPRSSTTAVQRSHLWASELSGLWVRSRGAEHPDVLIYSSDLRLAEHGLQINSPVSASHHPMVDYFPIPARPAVLYYYFKADWSECAA